MTTSTKITVEALEGTIGQVVAPYIGETMARAAVRAHYEGLGIVGPEANGEQVDALIGKIRGGLNVFVGQEKSLKIVEEIMKAIEATEDAS